MEESSIKKQYYISSKKDMQVVSASTGYLYTNLLAVYM